MYNLNTLSEFIDHMREIRNKVEFGHTIQAVVEHPPAFTGNHKVPSSSGFKLGESFGSVVGVLRALNFPLILVRPKEWQKGFSGLKGLTGHPRKRALCDIAKRLLPKAKLTVRNADAGLIAWYHFNNQQSKVS